VRAAPYSDMRAVVIRPDFFKHRAGRSFPTPFRVSAAGAATCLCFPPSVLEGFSMKTAVNGECCAFAVSCVPEGAAKPRLSVPATWFSFRFVFFCLAPYPTRLFFFFPFWILYFSVFLAHDLEFVPPGWRRSGRRGDGTGAWPSPALIVFGGQPFRKAGSAVRPPTAAHPPPAGHRFHARGLRIVSNTSRGRT